MDTGVHQFELTDARGQTHTYLVTEHPAGEGMEIMFSLLGLGAPTVLGLASTALRSEELLGAVLRALGGGDSGVSDLQGLGRLFAGLDLQGVAVELGRALGTGKVPELAVKVLSRVHRDGRPLGPEFDRAFQANYIELLTLIWKVCQINRFFPLPSTSESSSRAKETLPPGSWAGA